MTAPPAIRFLDGDAYEQSTGKWSRLAGDVFIDWLAPAPGLRWIDVGCGNGAFTEALVQRCAPVEVQGVDPSEAQIAYASGREAARGAHFQLGDAMALPFEADRFDAAVMALVIFFVPDPRQGVAEMARVVRPGGTVAAYAWDILGGGYPYEPIQAGLRAMGITPLLPPNLDASRIEMLRTLWTEAGLQAVGTREITVRRSFPDFETYWRVATSSAALGQIIASLTPEAREELKARVRAELRPATEPDGRLAHDSRANAVRGRVPG